MNYVTEDWYWWYQDGVGFYPAYQSQDGTWQTLRGKGFTTEQLREDGLHGPLRRCSYEIPNSAEDEWE